MFAFPYSFSFGRSIGDKAVREQRGLGTDIAIPAVCLFTRSARISGNRQEPQGVGLFWLGGVG